MQIANISINQICDFIAASEKRKVSIVKAQKYPSNFIITRYRFARKCMKKHFLNNFSPAVIMEGINVLQYKKGKTNHQESDRVNSILALEEFMNLIFPKYFYNKIYTFHKIENAHIYINGLKIIISPDIVFSYIEQGQRYIGGLKFRIVKSNSFDFEQASLSARLIRDYLEQTFDESLGIIDSNFCVCVDVFGNRVYSAPNTTSGHKLSLEITCSEIKDIWQKV